MERGTTPHDRGGLHAGRRDPPPRVERCRRSSSPLVCQRVGGEEAGNAEGDAGGASEDEKPEEGKLIDGKSKKWICQTTTTGTRSQNYSKATLPGISLARLL